MTRDEILAMTIGPVIDTLVAEKAMGWVVHPHNTAHWMLASDDVLCYAVRGMTSGLDRWAPSINIVAAWQVVERFSRPKSDGDLCMWIHSQVSFIERDGKKFWACKFQLDHATAASAPLAICRAALIASLT